MGIIILIEQFFSCEKTTKTDIVCSPLSTTLSGQVLGFILCSTLHLEIVYVEQSCFPWGRGGLSLPLNSFLMGDIWCLKS